MKKFLLRILLFSSPLIVVIFLYIIIDPFYVVHRDPQTSVDRNYITPANRDFQTVASYIRNHKKYKYDSFIMGNSRSLFYKTASWDQYISGKSVHFDASGETLYGIERKLNYLDENHTDIKNALLVIDGDLLKITKNSSYLFIKHPAITKESILAFQIEMFRGYLSKSFFAYTDLYFFGKKRDYMNAFGIKNNMWHYSRQNNELSYAVFDSIIAKNPDDYYIPKMKIFYKRSPEQRISIPSITNETQLKMLAHIKQIFDSHHTNFKIVISPLYRQLKMNPADLQFLRSLFGTENVFDFSGVNGFTNDYRNYYETSHYRPNVADSIMKIVYAKDKITAK